MGTRWVAHRSAGAFNHVLNDLSLIVNQFEGLSSFSAGLGRLATFVERMESYCDASECAADANATFVLRDEPRAAPARRVEATEAAAAGGAVLAIDGLRLETPDGNRELFGDLSLEVRGGDHLLVTGASGAGKSSLLRAVAGLWDRGEGSVVRPPRNETVFLPQRPYATLGSLRQQLVYPKTVAEAAARDEDLRAALETCRLGRLAASDLDTVRDWGGELSLGEQRRRLRAHARRAAAALRPRRGDVGARPGERGGHVRRARRGPGPDLRLRGPPAEPRRLPRAPPRRQGRRPLRGPRAELESVVHPV